MAIPTEKPSYGPLDGVKVVYAAVELACPKAADLMADWGADVTWLENTGAGDTIRDTAYIKQAERRNQRSVALNYFSEEGREIFLNMIRDADIFMEASKGGTWARKGLTDEVLWAVNPKLVIVHVSGFGQTGDPKMVKRAAYDLTVMAYAGIIMQNGTEEQPMLPGPYAGDYFNTLMIASSALAALYKAEKSGKGESIDLAMYETLLAIGQYYLVDYLNEGIKWPRPGAAQPESLRHWQSSPARTAFWACAFMASTRTSISSRPSAWGICGARRRFPRTRAGCGCRIPTPRRSSAPSRSIAWPIPSTRLKRTLPPIALPPRSSTTWRIWSRRSICACATPGPIGRRPTGRPSMDLASSRSSRTTPVAFGAPCPLRAATPVDVLTKLGYSDEQIARFAADGIVKCAE